MIRGPVTCDEIRTSEQVTTRYVQSQASPAEVHMLQVTNQVKKSSALDKLSPRLNDDGIIVVGGRLNHAPLGHLRSVRSFCHMVMLSVICWFKIITIDSIWGPSGFCLRYVTNVGLWKSDRWSSASNQSVSNASDCTLLHQYTGWPTSSWFNLVFRHSMPWISYQIRKIAGVHAPGKPGTFSPPSQVSDPDTHHGTCVTHVPQCMPGSLTRGFLWRRRWGKTFPAFPVHAQPASLRIW